MRVTAALLDIPLLEVQITDPAEIKSKSSVGLLPILETPEGHTLFDGLAIAKYLARQRPGFYGINDLESIHNSLDNAIAA